MNSSNRLRGKTAFIAGAGRNNGRVIAVNFARAGADVVLVARTMGDELNTVAKECEALGAKVLPLLADLSKPEDVNRAVEAGLARFGKVDVLLSATGMRPHKDFWKYDYDEWQQVFAVNLHSTFYLAKALAPSMMKRGTGSIIALGGRASLTSEPIGAAVVATKHGLYGLIKSLALELGPYGIRANLLALSNIENTRLNPEWYAARVDNAVVNATGGDPRDSPLGRTGTRQEVANVALFLASDESSYVTGDRIICAGGKVM